MIKAITVLAEQMSEITYSKQCYKTNLLRLIYFKTMLKDDTLTLVYMCFSVLMDD